MGGGDRHDGIEGARRLEAGLCVRVDDSAWSRPLNIAVQGAGGPFQVDSIRFSTAKGAYNVLVYHVVHCEGTPYPFECL